MKSAIKTGISFGLTSGVITTLGLMVGLQSGTNSKIAVVGGILTIAIADAFSDALGIHISEESKKGKAAKHIWTSTIATFLSKFIFAMTFIVPVLLLSLGAAIIVSIIWGLLLLSIYSYYLAKQNKEKPWRVIGEHVGIAIIVVIITHFVGEFIKYFFI